MNSLCEGMPLSAIEMHFQHPFVVDKEASLSRFFNEAELALAPYISLILRAIMLSMLPSVLVPIMISTVPTIIVLLLRGPMLYLGRIERSISPPEHFDPYMHSRFQHRLPALNRGLRIERECLLTFRSIR